MTSRLGLAITGWAAALSLVVVAPPATAADATAEVATFETAPTRRESDEGSAGFRRLHDYRTGTAELVLPEPATCPDRGQLRIGLHTYDYGTDPIGGAAAYVTCQDGQAVVSAQMLSVDGWVPAGIDVRFGDRLRFTQSCTADEKCSTTFSNETLGQEAHLVNEFDWGPWLGYAGIARGSDKLPPRYDELLFTDVTVNGEPIRRQLGLLTKMIKSDHTVIYGSRVLSKGQLHLRWRL